MLFHFTAVCFPTVGYLGFFSVFTIIKKHCNEYLFTCRFPNMSISVGYIPEVILMGRIHVSVSICTCQEGISLHTYPGRYMCFQSL